MRTALLFTAATIALRLGLFLAGVEPEAVTIVFALMGLVVLLAFLSGNALLREEPNAPLPAIFRVGLRSTAVFALLYALFLFAFFKWINATEFPMRLEQMVRDTVAQGIPEADVRKNMGLFFTPGKYAFLSFIGLLSLGAVNALFFAVVQHKFLRRLRR